MNKELLQIIYRDILSFGNLFEGNGALTVAPGEIEHSPYSVSAPGRKSHHKNAPLEKNLKN
jgi:hypothetical protein